MNNTKLFLKDFLTNLSIRLYLKRNNQKLKKEPKDDGLNKLAYYYYYFHYIN